MTKSNPQPSKENESESLFVLKYGLGLGVLNQE